MCKRTLTLILATAVGWIAYDFVAYFCGGEAATISWATIDLSNSWLTFTFLCGFLGGHLFWRAASEK